MRTAIFGSTTLVCRLKRVLRRIVYGTPTTPVVPQTVNRGYDSRRAAVSNLSCVQRILTSHGVEHAVLPSDNVLAPTVVVPYSSKRALFATFNSLNANEGWSYEVICRTGPKITNRVARRLETLMKFFRKGQITGFKVHRYIASPDGRILSTNQEAVQVQLWNSLRVNAEREDGGFHVQGTLVPDSSHIRTEVSYISPKNWGLAQSTNGLLPGFNKPLLQQVTEPIDVVYTWVDGSDPEWLRRKANALDSRNLADLDSTASSPSRFTNRDELKYSLRSIEMYASWVNHIYIVTDQQVPTWLDCSHPKVTIVDHRDIFSDPNVLPVFNSHAIESQLHHIDGLSERYLYMNDDVFFSRPVSPNMFFYSNGLAKFFMSIKTLDIDDVYEKDLPVMTAAKNGREFIKQEYNRVITRKFRHTPHAQRKKVLYDLEQKFPDLFLQMAKSELRQPSDYSVTSSLHHYHAYMMGAAIPATIKYGYIDIAAKNAEEKMTLLDRRNVDVFCINETDLPVDGQGRADRIVSNFLNKRFPLPSSFEAH